MKEAQKKKIEDKHMNVTIRFNIVELEDILDSLSYTIRETNWNDYKIDDLNRLNELKLSMAKIYKGVLDYKEENETEEEQPNNGVNEWYENYRDKEFKNCEVCDD